MPTRIASQIEPKDTIMTLVWGEPKSGKNTFVVGNIEAGLANWPTPIHIINMDWGTDELLPRVDPAIKDQLFIHDVEIDQPIIDVNIAKKALKDVYDGILDAQNSVTKAGHGTICIDTASQLWEIIRYVDLDDIKRVRAAQGKELYGYDYGDANERHRNLLLWLRNLPCHTVLLAHSEAIWTDKGPTGEVRPRVWKHLKGVVQESIYLQRDVQRFVGRDPVTTYYGTIEFSRHNNNVAEQRIPGLSFPTLYAMLFGKVYQSA